MMRRWLGTLATIVVLLVTVGLLLACWMPAYIGANDRPARQHQRNR